MPNRENHRACRGGKIETIMRGTKRTVRWLFKGCLRYSVMAPRICEWQDLCACVYVWGKNGGEKDFTCLQGFICLSNYRLTTLFRYATSDMPLRHLRYARYATSDMPVTPPQICHYATSDMPVTPPQICRYATLDMSATPPQIYPLRHLRYVSHCCTRVRMSVCVNLRL
jgi:hypothetical protein